MKRFIFKLMLFLAIIVVVDFMAGFVGDFLQTHAKGGYTRLTNDFVLKDSHDIIVFGSSRAKHHYDTPYLSDTLGLDVYNAGYEGCGVILADGLLELILERYTPKAIIYDVTYIFDIYEYANDNNDVRYLKWLKPYFRHQSVETLFKNVSKEEWYKVESGLIRYNSMLITMLQDNIIGNRLGNHGFEPMHGVLEDVVDESRESNMNAENALTIDSLKLKYVEHIIALAKKHNTQIVFVKSPRYGGTEASILQPIQNICEKQHVAFLNYVQEFQDPIFFCDHSHLNEKGARIFSQAILNNEVIKDVIKSY